MDKSEADALFARGIAHQQAGELDEAQAAYEKVLEAVPRHPHAPHLLGVIVSQRGQWHLARRLIETSLHNQSNDADTLANLAWVLYHLGEYALCVGRCDQAVALDPAHVRAWLNRGSALRVMGQMEPALASFDKVLQLRPGMAEALNYRGQCLHALERYGEALAAYEQAIAAEPRYADAHNGRGTTLTLLERPREAAEAFQAALDLQPRFPEALFNQGLGLQKDERFEEALARFDAALALRPDYPEALMHRAFALQRLRRLPQECVASLDKAIALRPRFFEALNGRANVLGQMELYAEALESYDLALAIKPDFHEALTNRGHALRELGRLEEAAASYRAAMQHGGDAHNGLFALAALGQGEAPSIAPRDYIVELFDGYAERFDDHLVKTLDYHAHDRLCEALLALDPRRPADMLDLGCGTGLCAPLLAPLRGSLTGVDLSPKMLDAARARGGYDRLVESDIEAFLSAEPDKAYDVVVSTDVFIYVGKLDAVFAGVRRCMRAGGLFGFSIESAGETQDYTLLGSRRYAQSNGYIRRLAAEHGFEVLSLTPCPIRKERGEYLPGHLGLLRAV